MVSLTEGSFSQGSLRIASFARPGKLFTASSSLMVGEVGLLKAGVTRQIIKRIIEMLQRGLRQSEINPGPTG